MMMARMGMFLAAVLAAGSLVPALQDAGPTEAAKTPEELFAEFRTSPDPATRNTAFDLLVTHGPETAARLKAGTDAVLARGEKDYIKLLIPKIRAEHLRRVGALTDAQVEHIAKTRRLWKDYLLNGGGRENFRETFLKPIHEMGKIFLFDVRKIGDEEILAHRRKLEEYAAYRLKLNTILKVNPDPSVGKKSPTGIAYAPLDQPPAFLDSLSHLERTLVLSYTVASEGARKVLMRCDEAAREIDVQEAEFTLFCNEVRMLAGTIAWRVDPLGSAVTRDHSNDRKEGRASGHMSDVPGKRGFGDRNKRMGAPFHNSEGAGGGRNGRSYANGLSYGGGHTGPLYSLKRNCVGVGRRAGVYTSQYRHDASIVHPCPATENELWMPPGIGVKDIRNAALLGVYKAMKVGAFGTAAKKVGFIQPKDELDSVLIKFFRIAIVVETDWVADSVLEIAGTGDVVYTKARLYEGLKSFRGVKRFEERVAEVAARVKSGEAQAELKAGKLFYRIVSVKMPEENRRQLMAGFVERHPETVYAAAFQAVLDDKEKKKQWYSFFLEKNPAAKNYGYPPALGK